MSIDINPSEIRQAFFNAWQKAKTKLKLTTLEQQLGGIITLHPEYQPMLSNPKKYQQMKFSANHNPFLHLGLHLSLQDQINTNRPPGVRQAYTRLCARLNDHHRAEHIMMEVMANLLWDAKFHGAFADERNYLERLNAATA